jgi:D-alanyl-D-alanine carboxypeptidase
MTITTRLQAALDKLVRGGRLPHVILAVESLDGRFRWTGAAGRADSSGAPMRADTPFFLASITKLYIAAAIFRLHESGRLRLDDPLRAYLPAPLINGLHRFEGMDCTDAITIHHLLSHTSGLPDSLEERPRGGKSLIERAFEQGDSGWTIEEAITLVREQLQPHFPPQDLNAPRARARYSDTNFQLLIAILEAVTGETQQDAFHRLLLRPLGLNQTWVAGHAPPDLPTPPAGLWHGRNELVLPRTLAASRDLYATAADALAFLRALIEGTVFERPATAELMRRRWRRFGFPLDAAALRLPPWPIEYGLGMMRFRLPRWLTPFAPVPAMVGHSGSTGSWLFHAPELGLMLTGTVDEVTSGAFPFRFLPRVLRMLKGVPLDSLE